jgi:hypothetical protein
MWRKPGNNEKIRRFPNSCWLGPDLLLNPERITTRMNSTLSAPAFHDAVKSDESAVLNWI